MNLEFNLIKDVELIDADDIELYNFMITQAIYVAERFYNLTNKRLMEQFITIKGEQSHIGHDDGFTGIQAQYKVDRGDCFLIQVVDEGEILFSEKYNEVPSKAEFIKELRTLYK